MQQLQRLQTVILTSKYMTEYKYHRMISIWTAFWEYSDYYCMFETLCTAYLIISGQGSRRTLLIVHCVGRHFRNIYVSSRLKSKQHNLLYSTNEVTRPPNGGQWTDQCELKVTDVIRYVAIVVNVLPHFRSMIQGYLCLRVGACSSSRISRTQASWAEGRGVWISAESNQRLTKCIDLLITT